jgi:thioredoxin reductase (NADPH)
MVYGSRVVSLTAEGDLRVVGLSDGSTIPAWAVIVATGVSYRLLDVPDLDRFLGAGVHYGAGMAQARAHAGRHVYVVGGGNSAGQAAMHFARFASQVTLVVRSGSLANSMSEYLIRDLEATSNVAVRFHSEVAGADGVDHLERLVLRDRSSGAVEAVDAAGVFILIGAAPFTAWLPPEVQRDGWGYIVTTGRWVADRSTATASAPALETSMPGVFAVGDVRQGSVKRVASAAGEGAICVRLVHEHLAGLRAKALGSPSR